MERRLYEEIRRDLTEQAMKVGSLLNIVQDDDEREALQEHYERVLNDELHAGVQNRRMARAAFLINPN